MIYHYLCKLQDIPKFLICYSKAINDCRAYSICVSFTLIVGISFNGVNDTIFYFFYDTGMISSSITPPIKENNITCFRGVISILPFSLFLIPFDTVFYCCIFWNCNTQITRLIGYPRYKTGTPFYTTVITIP